MSETNPIILGAASVRAELADLPRAHGLTRSQAERIAAYSDDKINQSIHAVADGDFWHTYYSIHHDAIARLASDPLVCVIFMQGQNYEDAVDAANALGGSTDAVVEHLAQWDYGKENDDAACVNGHIELVDLERQHHQLHEIDHGGLHYWLQLDHPAGIYGLYRRPLGA